MIATQVLISILLTSAALAPPSFNPRRNARPPPPSHVEYSTNWAGAVLSEAAGTWKAVTDTFTVPTPAAVARPFFAAVAPTRAPSSHTRTIALRTDPSPHARWQSCPHAHFQPLRLTTSTRSQPIRDLTSTRSQLYAIPACARAQSMTALAVRTGPYLYSPSLRANATPTHPILIARVLG
ncbi:hypothetical protein FIBSPDRAFT_1051210 [Athelia psychrophila]|uniref:Glycoside hydrolase family 16 protein n=1 Tax=Athelia psychrophila TaxID=1759441 RepID=A0A165ZHP4_9AGAM|nr:hypothetical protein FIBSPDRAFT_1051210 [Fibularhizoctonia sp. CBS 109695]